MARYEPTQVRLPLAVARCVRALMLVSGRAIVGFERGRDGRSCETHAHLDNIARRFLGGRQAGLRIGVPMFAAHGETSKPASAQDVGRSQRERIGVDLLPFVYACADWRLKGALSEGDRTGARGRTARYSPMDLMPAALRLPPPSPVLGAEYGFMSHAPGGETNKHTGRGERGPTSPDRGDVGPTRRHARGGACGGAGPSRPRIERDIRELRYTQGRGSSAPRRPAASPAVGVGPIRRAPTGRRPPGECRASSVGLMTPFLRSFRALGEADHGGTTAILQKADHHLRPPSKPSAPKWCLDQAPISLKTRRPVSF